LTAALAFCISVCVQFFLVLSESSSLFYFVSLREFAIRVPLELATLVTSLDLVQRQFVTSGFMLDLSETFIPASFDPFAEADVEDSGVGSKGSGYVHVRVQQRNGRKSLTTVQGLKKEFNYNKILKDLKKEFCCNGVVVQDPELGQVIQLQGDQRKNVSNFLVQAGIVKKDLIKIHGF
jgi:translation initiation factor 1